MTHEGTKTLTAHPLQIGRLQIELFYQCYNFLHHHLQQLPLPYQTNQKHMVDSALCRLQKFKDKKYNTSALYWIWWAGRERAEKEPWSTDDCRTVPRSFAKVVYNFETA